MIYFDNAATSYPKPECVKKAANSFFEDYGANPGRGGYRMSAETAIQVHECRVAISGLFNALLPENIVFTGNCTHSLNLVIKGIMQKGGHMIISDLEHNSVLRPADALMRKNIAAYSIAKTFSDDDMTVKSFESLISPRTKLIACTHASNAFGVLLPVKRLAKLAHKYGILILVDAAQTAGVIDIDIQQAGVDFLCAAGHKGLLGPTGTGILITKIGGMLSTVIEGGTGSSSLLAAQPDYMPERLESGTLNTIGILGLKAGVEYLAARGIENIYNHDMILAGYIYDRLSKIKKVKLYTAKPQTGKFVPVISFNITDIGSEQVAAELEKKGFALRAGLHCSPLAHKKMGTRESGTVRISIGASNTQEECELLCDAIESI